MNNLAQFTNIDEFKANVSKMSNDKLCEIIICFRYLGLCQEQCLISMEELARRRANGDVFDFEKVITDKIKTLPKIQTDISSTLKSINMMSMFGQFTKK